MTWMALLAACSEGPTVAGTPPRTVPLCAPFAEWDLPVQDGVAVTCDPRRLELHYPAGRADALGPQFRLAVRLEGWVEEVDSTAAGLVNVRYTRTAESAVELLGLSAIDGADHTSVILTRHAPPEEGSP